jgi:SAM-dependent methyltransferase
MMRKAPPAALAALCLLSLALVGYELAVMRCFSVASWANFGSMVIGIALLGSGIAGTLLTFLEKRVLAAPRRWLRASALALAPAMALAHVLAQVVPFNPVMMTTDPTQAAWLGLYYVLYAAPFFIGSMFIGLSFIAYGDRIHALYFWNMLGSGLGGLLVLGLLFVLPPSRLVGPLVGVAAVAALAALVDSEAGRPPSLRLLDALAAATLLCLSIGALTAWGDLRVSEFKPISYARDFPDSVRVSRSWGPTGDYEVYRSSYFHVAPGLSDNASSALADLPEDAFLGLYVDGDGPMGIMRRLAPAEEAYFDYLPIAAPFAVLDRPKVLELRLGGGMGVQAALRHGAASVTVVEPDPALLRMLRDEPVFRDYTGGLLADRRVRTVASEPRAFAGSTRERFDLVEIGLVDSVGLSQTGGNPVTENFLYTAEGLASFISVLRPGGVLSVTVWNRLTPPRNVPKLLSTVVEALRIRAAAGGGKPGPAAGGSPGDSIFVFNQLLSTATVLVKNGPWNAGEIAALRRFCERMSFVPCWYPGMQRPAISRDAVLESYARRLSGARPAAVADGAAGADGAGGGEESRADTAGDLYQEDLYYYIVDAFSRGGGAAIREAYPFAVDPATDNRPYYTAYVKLPTLPAVAADLRDLSEEWGYVLLVATLAISAAFGLLVVLIPVFGRWRELFTRRRGTLRVLLYFGAIGLGYMTIEIFLIQRLTFFLVDPVFANTGVITAMLVVSGLGSLAGGASRMPRCKLVTLAASGVALSCLFYALGLTPLVNAGLGLPIAAKLAIAMVIAAPAAFCMGIPFPSGLAALSKARPGLVPWAWGVNGALSVTGSALARFVSVQSGFAAALGLAAALYLAAAASWSGNEAAL